MLSTVKAPQKKVSIFGIEKHRETVNLRLGERFLVRLFEDPALGYGWRVNKTSGLLVADSWFAPSEPARQPGGGLHYWRIRAKSPGRQIFRAIYRGRNDEYKFSRRSSSSSR